MAPLLALLLIASPGAPDREVARIHAHLERVESELRAGGDAGLTASPRRWRARLLDELRAYRTRGRFPQNTFVDRVSPVFVDRSGTRCAVAQLIAASGRGDLVARIAATRNTAYVAELSGDRELAAWLDEHGFTAAEAARIQPTYQSRETGSVCWSDADCVSGECLAHDAWVAYCTAPCGSDRECPEGLAGAPMECAADDQAGDPRCEYPGIPPGAIGAPCGDGQPCVEVCLSADEAPACTYYCTSAYECPDGHACRSRGEADGAVVCVPDDGGRCAIAGAGSGRLAALLLLLAAGTAARRLRGRRAGQGQ